MKVCLINNLYQPFERGGAEKITANMQQGFRRLGHEAVIITTKPYSRAKPARDNVYYLNSFFPKLDKLPKPIRLIWHMIDGFDVFIYFRVKKILRLEKPDLVAAHNLKGLSLLIPLAARRLGIKYIQVLHDIQYLHPSGLMYKDREKILDSVWARLYQAFNRRLFGSPGLVISPSSWLLDLYRGRGFFPGSKTKVIRSPIDAPEHPSAVNGPDSRVFRFIYASIIEEHKGIFTLLQAFRRLLNADGAPAAALTIIGEGRMKEKARQTASDMTAIAFFGYERRRALREIARSHCLVAPSICYENSPTVIYEAAAAGTAVIASRLGGITELVHELGGLLFTPGDADDLAAKMAWAMRRPGEIKAIGERAGQRVRGYSLNHYIREILNSLE